MFFWKSLFKLLYFWFPILHASKYLGLECGFFSTILYCIWLNTKIHLEFEMDSVPWIPHVMSAAYLECNLNYICSCWMGRNIYLVSASQIHRPFIWKQIFGDRVSLFYWGSSKHCRNRRSSLFQTFLDRKTVFPSTRWHKVRVTAQLDVVNPRNSCKSEYVYKPTPYTLFVSRDLWWK